jgi:hypothetical protein
MTNTMTAAEFLASLPAPLSRRGADYASDVVLAKRIRAELAQAVKVGAIAAHTEFSVRINHHSSLTVEIVRWGSAAVFHPRFESLLMAEACGSGSTSDFDRRSERPYGALSWHAELSDELNTAVHTAELIADRHNFNESRIEVDYFHVGYYLTVNANHVRKVAQHGIALEMDSSFRALFERAHEAARSLPKNVIKAECGKAGVRVHEQVDVRAHPEARRARERSPARLRQAPRPWVPTQEAA